MDHVDYLLIGGGLASAKAVQTIRSRDAVGSILLVTEEDRLPYDRPPLSKEIIRGEAAPEEIASEGDSYYHDHGVTTRIGVKVTAIELGDHRHRAVLSSGESVSFSRALLATGGLPRRLGVPGESLPGVHTLRNLDDALAIAAAASPAGAGQARAGDGPSPAAGDRAVIVGAGFIGVELAASLRQCGMAVTVVEMAAEIWPSFAPSELARAVRERCEARGVEFRFGRRVSAFEERSAAGDPAGAGGPAPATTEVLNPERGVAVVLDNGERIHAALACVAVGIEPAVEIARDAGLAVADGVVVNEHLQSSHPDIFVAGDIAQVPDPFFGDRRRVEHYGNAEYGGLLAGQNMTGESASFSLLSYLWSDVFDMHLEAAGAPDLATRFVRRDPPPGETPSAGDGPAETNGTASETADSPPPSFMLIGLDGEGKVVSYMALNRPDRDFAPLQIMIKKGISVGGKEDQLADPSAPLVQLLKG